MGNVIKLFTSFNGRINRASWWLGVVAIVVLSVGGTLVLNPDYYSFEPGVVPNPNWAATIWGLLLVFPMTAITVKRFNDRDWPHWLGYAYGLLAAVQVVGQHFGFLAGPGISITEAIGLIIVVLVGLFVLIDNGFLRGTKGPNRYGPDPLQST